jgi:hypothetical protein
MSKLSQIEKHQITINTQDLYDNFNQFIFSNNTNLLAKLLFRAEIFKKTIGIPGDILECGIFKGSGISSWSKIRKIFAPNSFKRVIGFDFFDNKKLLESLEGKDKESMAELFSGRKFDFLPDYTDILTQTLINAGINKESFELIQGDVSETSLKYIKDRPGSKISILYLDMDLATPTYNALTNFWPRVSKGGYVVFDEYAYSVWSETQGVDRFLEENDLTIKTFDCNAPTAYIIKNEREDPRF